MPLRHSIIARGIIQPKHRPPASRQHNLTEQVGEDLNLALSVSKKVLLLTTDDRPSVTWQHSYRQDSFPAIPILPLPNHMWNYIFENLGAVGQTPKLSSLTAIWIARQQITERSSFNTIQAYIKCRYLRRPPPDGLTPPLTESSWCGKEEPNA